MGESVLAGVVGLDQVVGGRLHQAALNRLDRLAHHLRQQVDGEGPADHGSDAQRVDRLCRQSADAQANRREDAGRNGAHVPAAQGPSLRREEQGIGVVPAPQELHGEERIAFAVGLQGQGAVRGQRRAQGDPAKLGGLTLVQGRQGDALRPEGAMQRHQGTLEGGMRGNSAFLVGAEDQQASRRLMAGHVGEQVETGRIGPLKIVENEHQRLAGGQCGKEPPDRFEETQARLGRGQRWGGDGMLQAGGEIREDRCQDERARTDVGHQQFDGRLPNPGAEGFQERQVRRHGLGFGSASPQHAGSSGGEPLRSNRQEVALADAWISYAQGNAEPAAPGVLEGGAN